MKLENIYKFYFICRVFLCVCVCVYKFCSLTLWFLIYSLEELLFYFANTWNNNNIKKQELNLNNTHCKVYRKKYKIKCYQIIPCLQRPSKHHKKKHQPNILTQFDVDFGVNKATRNLFSKKKTLNLWTEIQNPQTPNCKIYNNNTKYYLELSSDVSVVAFVVVMKIKWKQFVWHPIYKLSKKHLFFGVCSFDFVLMLETATNNK